MLDLDLIKARLVAVDSLEYGSYKKLLQHAAMDIEELVAEVERLRAAIALHRDRWRSGVGSGAWVHRKLWETLDAD
jgi:hypothetical protein